MLSGVPAGISPELLKVLHEMGHGDTLVIGDANFPAASIAAEKNHINIMDKMEMHRDLECPVWDEFTDIVAKHDERGADAVGFLDRFAFYDAAKDAYAVVSTSETAFYACIMIQKGCL